VVHHPVDTAPWPEMASESIWAYQFTPQAKRARALKVPIAFITLAMTEKGQTFSAVEYRGPSAT